MPAVVDSLKKQSINRRSLGFAFLFASKLLFLLFALFLNTAGLTSIVLSELKPNSDYRTAFSELPAIDLPCISQSKLVSNRNIVNTEAVAVRFALDKNGKAWLVISNDYPWRESFEVQWNGLFPEVIRSLGQSPKMIVDVDGMAVATKTQQRSSRWRCDIEPHSHGGWELRASEATIASWQHRAEPAALAELENQLATLNQSLTNLTQFRPLENTPLHGGFEITSEANSLPPGWQVSLNPSTVWQTSNAEARSGSRSLQFLSRHATAIGWIQSPVFDLPDDGRLAAAAWIHVDPAVPRPKIVVTTTLLKPDGSRQEWKQTYQRNEVFDTNTKWHRIDFPTLNSNSLGTSVDPACKVRLALDIEGPSQLWIDDIFASKIFLDEEERRQLRSELFVARRELSQNRPSLAWQLTQSEKFRNVFESVPLFDLAAEHDELPTFENMTKPTTKGPDRQAERQPMRRKLR